MFKRLKRAGKRTKVVEQSGSSDDEANKYITERDDLIRQTDIPERMQKRTEKRSVEVSVLLNKIKKEDIMRFLELHHVEKFDVLWIIKELDMWLLFQKRMSVLQMHQRKIYDEECLKIDNSEKYTLNKQLFESISKSLNEAEMKEEIDDVDAKYTLNKLLSGST
ncbi:hypothetical protein PVK06_033745 [Gossypium arboreum]|uniref:Uncharacterized protein n=1 Tax=Gossypium arboreum TaxID=29729 RepID=A0ABR0NCB5_GOSAR|nr:hypothetical protein PVK06_033745 [Gossypium arboreum]